MILAMAFPIATVIEKKKNKKRRRWTRQICLKAVIFFACNTVPLLDMLTLSLIRKDGDDKEETIWNGRCGTNLLQPKK